MHSFDHSGFVVFVHLVVCFWILAVDWLFIFFCAPIGAVDAHGAFQQPFLFGDGFDADLPHIKADALRVERVEEVSQGF